MDNSAHRHELTVKAGAVRDETGAWQAVIVIEGQTLTEAIARRIARDLIGAAHEIAADNTSP